MQHKNDTVTAAPPPQLSHPKYRPDIDGLRALAVLSVVAFHAFPGLAAYGLSGGFIGVDVFFVISGFLISTIIFENLDKGTFSFTEFYSRRITRIFPALLLVLIASYAFGWFALLADEYKHLGKHIATGAGFFSNFALWNEAGYFDNTNETKPLLHLWSLGIEEQFYIVWPLLLWAAWKKKFNLLTITILVLAISFYLNVKGIKKDAVATFYSPQTRFWELLCGSVLAWVTLYKKDSCSTFRTKLDGYLASNVYREKPVVDGNALSNVISFIGMSLLVYGFCKITNEARFPGTWALLPVLGTVLIIAAGPIAWVNRVILSNRIAVRLGLISFPLYLWHWPLLSFARIVESEVPSRNIRITAVLISIVLAWLTYKLVERPIRFRKQSRIKTATLVFLMFVVGGVGYGTYHDDGIVSRTTLKGFADTLADLNFNLDRGKGWLCDEPEFQCLYEGVKPSVVIVGDSHTPRIYSGLRSFYHIQGKGVGVFGGGNGCPPLLNVVSKDNTGEDTRNCIKNTTASLLRIINDDDIKEVVFASRGPLYTTSNGFGDFDGDRFGNWVLHFNAEAPGYRSNSEVYEIALGHTFEALAKAGKKITYLHDVPELGFDIRSCIPARPFSISKKIRTPCAVKKEHFIKRNEEFRALVSRVLVKFPTIHTVDLADALCDNEWCYGGKDDVLFYTDDDHLSHRGSQYVIDRLKSKF
jgi:peptidoglycan/LPS O-acetylase OafA/YrhL